MPRKGGYIYGYDVHARCPQCGYLADGSRSGTAEAPECVQHRFHELRPGQCVQVAWANGWDWMPQFDLESMTVDMLEKLRAKLNK